MNSQKTGTAPPEQLTEAVKRLYLSLRTRAFYPKGHGAVTASLAKLKQSLDALLKERSEITIVGTGRELVFEGLPFAKGNKLAGSLARHLKTRNISSVTFRSGITEKELAELTEALSESSDEPASNESPMFERDARTGRVTLTRIRYGALIRHVRAEDGAGPSGEDAGETWGSIVMQDVGYGEADRPRRVPEQARRARSVKLVVEALENMDPRIASRLPAEQGGGDFESLEDLVDMIAEKIDSGAGPELLAALFRSQNDDYSRLSSVFNRVAGAEKRRPRLMEAVRQKAADRSDRDEESVAALWSAVQDLVISESKERFVGSDYGSMLEEMVEKPEAPEGGPDCEGDHLAALRGSLDPEAMPATRARFLTDLAGFHEGAPELEMTLQKLDSTCSLLCEEKDFGTVVEVCSDLACHAADLRGPDKEERRGLLLRCLRSILGKGVAVRVLSELTGSGCDSRLRAVLEASGPEMPGDVCAFACSDERALGNKLIADYIGGHPDQAAEAFGGMLADCPAPHARRALLVLSSLRTRPAVEVIRSALERSEDGVKVEAVKALGKIGTKEAVDALDSLLSGGDPNLARLAAGCLGESASPESAAVLIRHLERLDFFGKRIREARHVAEALGKSGDNAAVPQLERTLRRTLLVDSNCKRTLREAAARSLRRIGGEEALAALRRGASCRNRQVREICSLALERSDMRSPRTKGRVAAAKGDVD